MGKGMAAKSQYRIPIESLEKALVKMNSYKTKATPMAVYYRRADGLHLVLSSRMRKKGKIIPKSGKRCREGGNNNSKGS